MPRRPRPETSPLVFVLPLLLTLTSTTAGLVGAQEPTGEVTALEPGATVERTVAPGESHAYTLDADDGRLVRIAVEQRDADVAVRVFGPSGGVVRTFSSPSGAWGPEPVVFPTDTSGTYRLVVRRPAADPGEVDEAEEVPGEEIGSYVLRLGSPPPLSATPAGRADQILDAWDRSDGPGAVAAFVEGGRLVYARAMGLASLEHDVPITPETVFDIGSVSKQLTDFAVVLLARRGHLAFEDDIRSHLPEVPDFGRPIRIRHLIHHTSGLREIYAAAALAGRQSGDGIAQEHALRLVSSSRELNFPPGTEYLYCNTGYMLLADIVSRVTGTPFARWMEDEVFGPLEMEHTTIMARRGQVVEGAADSYGPDGSGGFVRIFDNSGIQGAGGVYTTVGDLARWLGHLGEPDPGLGGPDAVRQMQQRGVLADGDTLDYAFGLRIDEHRGLRRIGHTGSSAGYRAVLAYYPEADVGLVVLSNFAGWDRGALPELLAEAWLAGAMKPRERPSPSPDDEAEADEEEPEVEVSPAETWRPSATELEAFRGRYVSPELETVYTIVWEEDRLVAHHRRHGGLELTPTEEADRFRGEYPLSELRFERDEDGRITGFRVSNGRVRNLVFVLSALPGSRGS